MEKISLGKDSKRGRHESTRDKRGKIYGLPQADEGDADVREKGEGKGRKIL